MTLPAVVVFCVLAGLVLVQAAMVCVFTAVLRNRRFADLADDDCPKTAVVLCLRGSDPYLAHTLDAVLDLDYPRFDLRVVVDDRDDPAWAVVEEAIRRSGAGNARIEPLSERRESCSLKCSGVLQAVSQLDDSYQVVALLDADTIPHRRWLRELVAPLADDKVGAATGNRWYMPHHPSWAAMVRYVWNAAAVPQMFWYQIAWGGTLAVKTEVFRRGDLLDRWAHAFCEDTMLFRMLRRHGLKVAFVPALMMVNRENCTLGGFFRWVRRQLLTARLYHPGWPAVVLHGVSTTVWPALAVALGIYGLIARDWQTAAWGLSGFLLYEACMPPLIMPMEWAVRRIAGSRGEGDGWISPATVLRFPLAVLLTQAVYAAALTSALLLRRVDWRGVDYQIDGPFRIRMLEYRPFRAETADEVRASL